MVLIRNHKIEIYDIERSPFSLSPTQREVAVLLGENRDDLRRLINYKEFFIVRREEKIRGKLRQLAYPISRLRAVHERLKFHLNKIVQPSYLFSPRRGKSQIANASLHLAQNQYLTLDLKQFYPSTSSSMIRNFFHKTLGMKEDVAGLLTHLTTIDSKASFGSPLTPVLCTLVHREMFDEIAAACDKRGLRYSVWVDDLTISGKFVPGKLLREIRLIIGKYGLKSHKIKYKVGNRPVFITGIGVVGGHLIAPNSLNLKIRELWIKFHRAEVFEEREDSITKLLSNLGMLRAVVGNKSDVGQRASNQINSLRQKRDRMHKRRVQERLKAAKIRHESKCHTNECPF